MFGEYRLLEGALVVGELYEDDSSVSCEPARNEQAAWMRRFLDGSPAYEQDGPRPILTDDLVTLALLDDEVADPDRPLVGPTWEIDGLADAGNKMLGSDSTPTPSAASRSAPEKNIPPLGSTTQIAGHDAAH